VPISGSIHRRSPLSLNNMIVKLSTRKLDHSSTGKAVSVN
jgi:hypothetical protein